MATFHRQISFGLSVQLISVIYRSCYITISLLSKFRLRTNTQGYFRAKWSLRVFQFKLKSIQVALEIKKNPQVVSQAILWTRMPLDHAFSE